MRDLDLVDLDKVLERHTRGPITTGGKSLLVTCVCGWSERIVELGRAKAQHRRHVAGALASELGMEVPR